MIYVKEIQPTRTQLRPFIQFPFKIYREDPYFVPPLLAEQMNTLLGKNNRLFENGVQKFFMAYEEGRPVARLLAGIDEKIIARTGIRQAYISLFECIHNQEAANHIFDAAKDFLKAHQIDCMIGPNPATFDDFNKGMLVEGFDGPPVLFNPYNPSYYMELFENYGFTKHKDHFAYIVDLDDFEADRYLELIDRAQQRFGFRVEHPDFSNGNLQRLTRDIATVVSEAFPADWEILPPTPADIYSEFKQLRMFINPHYVVMAYAGDRPIGLLVAIPDYNQLIQKMKGRLFPTGIFRFFFGQKSIDQLRAVMQFVVPEYQNKAVNGVMFYKAFVEARKRGIVRVEGSTVDESNVQSQLSVEKAGGKVYRIYRQYKLQI